MTISIRSLEPGDRVRVAGLARGDRGYRQRLLAMGLTPGVEFTLKRVAPLGDPIEISVRNFALTLRRDEASVLELERLS
jgi:ferrous iron transport protein A